ncbi:MAG: hypothetical protein Q8P84_00435, partial [Deltaproteobacteria bacterium]|nr:hypothetical protein [Deltaproteobacteria bacterium]
DQIFSHVANATTDDIVNIVIRCAPDTTSRRQTRKISQTKLKIFSAGYGTIVRNMRITANMNFRREIAKIIYDRILSHNKKIGPSQSDIRANNRHTPVFEKLLL